MTRFPPSFLFSFNNVVDAYGKDGQLARSLVQPCANAAETAGVDPLNEVGSKYALPLSCFLVFLFLTGDSE